VSVVELLQGERGRSVVVEEGGAVVRKSFTGPDGALEATREYECLQRFHGALGTTGAARCPRPIELAMSPTPFVRMERAPGVPLNVYLARHGLDDQELDELGATLATGVTTYVEAVGEPYFDFHLRNLVYEPSRGAVTFVDFGVPFTFDHALIDRVRALAPLDASAGQLLGSTLFEVARPRTLLNRRRHAQSLRLVDKVLDRLATGRDDVRSVARASYAASAASGGAPALVWHRTIGNIASARARRRFLRAG
jgi:hypothetical protein